MQTLNEVRWNIYIFRNGTEIDEKERNEEKLFFLGKRTIKTVDFAYLKNIFSIYGFEFSFGMLIKMWKICFSHSGTSGHKRIGTRNVNFSCHWYKVWLLNFELTSIYYRKKKLHYSPYTSFSVFDHFPQCPWLSSLVNTIFLLS